LRSPVTLIFFSDIPWDSLYQRPQHLATRLSHEAQVLWIEPATLGSRVIISPREEIPGVFRMTLPEIPLNARNTWIRRLASIAGRIGPLRSAVRALQRALLRRGLRQVLPSGGGTACLVQNFRFMHLTGMMKSRAVVFDYIDDAFGFADFPDHVRREWRATIQHADAVSVTSPTLRHRVLDVSPREVRIVPNGVEFERFAHPATTARPADLPGDGLPVVGYAGSIYPWLDFGLLEHAIGALGEFRFVFIGHIHPSVAARVARLGRFRNFSYLGLKPYAEVPAYVRRFAAGVIPFRRTLLTEAVNPVKLYEYCAAGVPTVVTDFSDDMRSFADLILIARTDDEFVHHLRTAVARRSEPLWSARLSSFAKENDWDSRAREFSTLLHLSDTMP
jgi:glycosyltransferase involved in cell wall biosynthesis